MLRAAVWTLRQKRYATLAVALWALVLVCVAAGTFELHRYVEKRHDNHALRMNAAAPSVPLTSELVPVTGEGRAPSTTTIRYRTVSVTGTYLAGQTRLVDNQSQGGNQGFYVVTPFRTSGADLLVARGFVAETSAGRAPAKIAAPPRGAVRISGRLQTTTPQINAGQASSRLGRPVFQAWLSLDKAGAGTSGLRSLPKPGLGNPTGGAGEWQLLSYVIQWYVFGLLALVGPFLFARAEVRANRKRFLGIDEDEIQFDAVPLDARTLATGDEPAALTGARRSGELMVRGQSSLVMRDPAAAARLARAQRLADRYGRPLGPDPERAMTAAVSAPVSRDEVVRDSTSAAYRTIDEYHANYNDYLWQLALADGNIPQVVPRIDESGDATGPTSPTGHVGRGHTDERPAREPRIVDGETADGETADGDP